MKINKNYTDGDKIVIFILGGSNRCFISELSQIIKIVLNLFTHAYPFVLTRTINETVSLCMATMGLAPWNHRYIKPSLYNIDWKLSL